MSWLLIDTLRIGDESDGEQQSPSQTSSITSLPPEIISSVEAVPSEAMSRQQADPIESSPSFKTKRVCDSPLREEANKRISRFGYHILEKFGDWVRIGVIRRTGVSWRARTPTGQTIVIYVEATSDLLSLLPRNSPLRFNRDPLLTERMSHVFNCLEVVGQQAPGSDFLIWYIVSDQYSALEGFLLCQFNYKANAAFNGPPRNSGFDFKSWSPASNNTLRVRQCILTRQYLG
jgi:hypothetical protein